jgi:hypothetical protein
MPKVVHLSQAGSVVLPKINLATETKPTVEDYCRIGRDEKFRGEVNNYDRF